MRTFYLGKNGTWHSNSIQCIYIGREHNNNFRISNTHKFLFLEKALDSSKIKYQAIFPGSKLNNGPANNNKVKKQMSSKLSRI